MPPSLPAYSCAHICASFTLNNATILLSTQSYAFSDVVVYDTMLKASTGPPVAAKLYISGHHTYPDGSIICAIVKGGPVHPYGYLLQASNIISLGSNPPLYRDILRRSRISATGVIISTCRVGDEDIYFDLETANHVGNSSTTWTLRCIVPLTVIRFTPALNDHVTVLGLLHRFIADHGRRKLEIDASDIIRYA